MLAVFVVCIQFNVILVAELHWAEQGFDVNGALFITFDGL